ncbi:hypothetical protein BBK82_11390 [Lentzea guizhouensis]|uniref:Transmembrane protein n=1 Tax=Lentzea guizhouensis TaxID=1586287 RepID=A0A1B2HFR3_9PSEU|nr:hypothetical protein BBK82_11390 [Lentzea guizhouensis]
MGALLGLVWWGVFGLIASGAVCTKDDYGCLGTAVMTVPIFTVVAAVAGWLALRAAKVPRPWLAVPATLMAVATTVFFALGYFWAAVPIFAVLYALAAVVTTPRS